MPRGVLITFCNNWQNHDSAGLITSGGRVAAGHSSPPVPWGQENLRLLKSATDTTRTITGSRQPWRRDAGLGAGGKTQTPALLTRRRNKKCRIELFRKCLAVRFGPGAIDRDFLHGFRPAWAFAFLLRHRHARAGLGPPASADIDGFLCF